MLKRVAFVLGGANTLHSDLHSALCLCQPHTLIATNHAGRDFMGILPHWCTLHTEKMPQWIEERRAKNLPDAKNFWTSNIKTVPSEHENLYRRVPSWNGSSGLLAIQVGLELGYDRIVLCGVPLDRKAEHYDVRGDWPDAPRYRSAWTKNIRHLRGKVKSFSGWTRDLLGEPTVSWLYSSVD